MSPTERQRQNLKKGPGSPETARRAMEARLRIEGEDRAAGERVQQDPEASLALLHGDLVKGGRQLTRKWLNTRGEPSRQLVGSWTELRRLTAEVATLRRMRGTVAEDSDAFWRTLDSRCRDLGVDLRELAATAKPIMHLPETAADLTQEDPPGSKPDQPTLLDR